MTTLCVLKREGIRAGRAGPADLETIGQCFDLTVHGVAKLTQLCVVMPEVQKVNLQWLPTHALNCMLPHKNHTESDAVGEDSQLLTAVEWRILQDWECTPVILNPLLSLSSALSLYSPFPFFCLVLQFLSFVLPLNVGTNTEILQSQNVK